MVVAESEILSEFEEFGIQLEANIVLKGKVTNVQNLFKT